MAHVTIEYVIMIPLLILQIVLFPLTANWLMNQWVDSRLTQALKDSASRLGSTVLQLYSSLNRATIQAGTVLSKPNLPPLVENYYYLGTAILRPASNQANSSSILTITLNLAARAGQAQIKVDSSVTLGPYVHWENSTFISNSANVVVSAQKLDNGTINLKFG